MRPDKLDIDRSCVLVIDVQTKLLPAIRHQERVVASCRRLLEGARIFSIPIVATEQYPRGIGPTQADVADCLSRGRANVVEKPTFSAWEHGPCREALLALDRPQVVIVGIEAHVCVQQTALDLGSRDYDVFVCADAVGSRGRIDYECALGRMRQAGVFVTGVESVLFEWCHRCDTPKFKEMLEVIKSMPPPNE